MYHTRIDNTDVHCSDELVQKYDRPGPRYTSYPTAPQWHDTIPHTEYLALLADSARAATPLSLYLHLPFCEAHCTFCGCNVVITKKKSIAESYLDDLARELELLAPQLAHRKVAQLHIGGGTPTYLTPAQLDALSQKIRANFRFTPNAELSIEADPRVTTAEHLHTLRRCGFNRLSFGVQDLTPRVQAAINRLQPLALTERLIATARELRFDSINVDLIYGLPWQTVDSFADTVKSVLAVEPDRIACFNFAYVPWLKAQQRAIDPATLPNPHDKLTMWCRAITQCADAGYELIGFDHFAKAHDELAVARREGTLSRNFQGYTTQAGIDMVGFGITSIGDIGGVYVQNVKKIPEYRRRLLAHEAPLERACRLTADDCVRRTLIRTLLCNNAVHAHAFASATGADLTAMVSAAHSALQPLLEDGLATWDGRTLAITPQGRLFARNIAMCFDAYLAPEQAADARYSRTV